MFSEAKTPSFSAHSSHKYLNSGMMLLLMTQSSQIQQASWWSATDAEKASHFHVLMLHPLSTDLTPCTVTPVSLEHTINA